IPFAGEDHGLALAGDGQTVIAASGNSLKWLDGQRQREMQTLTVGTNAVTGISWALDQPGLVAYRSDKIKAFSPTGEALLGAGLDAALGTNPNNNPDLRGAFAVSWDGTLLADSGTNSTVRIFDVKTGHPLGPKVSLGEDEHIFSMAF